MVPFTFSSGLFVYRPHFKILISYDGIFGRNLQRLLSKWTCHDWSQKNEGKLLRNIQDRVTMEMCPVCVLPWQVIHCFGFPVATIESPHCRVVLSSRSNHISNHISPLLLRKVLVWDNKKNRAIRFCWRFPFTQWSTVPITWCYVLNHCSCCQQNTSPCDLCSVHMS